MYAADPKTEQEIRAFIRAYEKSFNANDAPALAALCTEDAVQIGPEGPISGRQAIEKKYVDLFRESHPSNIVCTIDLVGMLGNVSWNSGAWGCTLHAVRRQAQIFRLSACRLPESGGIPICQQSWHWLFRENFRRVSTRNYRSLRSRLAPLLICRRKPKADGPRDHAGGHEALPVGQTRIGRPGQIYGVDARRSATSTGLPRAADR